MKRREFLTLIGGAAAAWPVVARAQQSERVRRIGMLTNLSENDAEGQARIAAFRQGLQQLGWTDGRNVQIDARWTEADAERTRRYAAELVALSPDLILAVGAATVASLQQITRSVPIVFVVLPDPVGAGIVESLSHPGGNATGFTNYEYGIAAKWLELLKAIAPGAKRVGVLRDAATSSGPAQFAAMQSVAPSLGIEVSPIGGRDAVEIERGITSFARVPNGSLIVTGSALAAVHHALIVKLAAHHKLPAVYFQRFFLVAGGLLSYGPNYVDQHRLAAGYADRILRGEKPADLPVQTPTKYELGINLKTAKALGLTVPLTLIARADEVIE